MRAAKAAGSQLKMIRTTPWTSTPKARNSQKPRCTRPRAAAARKPSPSSTDAAITVTPTAAPGPPIDRRCAAATKPATAPTSGPPNTDAMARTADRPSKMRPGASTMGISMPTTHMPPKISPEHRSLALWFSRQKRALKPCSRPSARISAVALMRSRAMSVVRADVMLQGAEASGQAVSDAYVEQPQLPHCSPVLCLSNTCHPPTMAGSNVIRLCLACPACA
jgi:hypothetical protein